jgi:hypothetical protein
MISLYPTGEIIAFDRSTNDWSFFDPYCLKTYDSIFYAA